MSPLATSLKKEPGNARTTAVVGLGISGMSCLRYLSRTDALVVIDDRLAPANLEQARRFFPAARYFVGEDAKLPQRWHGVERVVLSPGVAANDPVLAGSENLPRMSDIDLFIAAAKAPVVGITGTNGKSTVTSLLAHLLHELGIRVRVGGNLGEPALDLLCDSAQIYVLELSSFQLEHSSSLPLAAAAVLNLSVDHLDRHGDLNNYAAIKRRIYSAARICVSNADDPLTRPETGIALGSAKHFSFGLHEDANWRLLQRDNRYLLEHNGSAFADAMDFALTGQHNLLNILAALALAAALDLPGLPDFSTSQARYVRAAAGFTGLEHRAEFVRELRGVRYINDSKATNVGACVAALAGFDAGGMPGQGENRRRVVLLAGGQGKGADFSPLGPVAARCVKVALLFGEDAQKIQDALLPHTTVERCGSFEAAVAAAARLAVEGDTVLLAPACASFDLFANFAARGQRFRELVEALA